MVFDNITFDSKVECEFYQYLLKKHDRKDIIIQPSFELQPKFTKNGIKYRSITYIADFQVDNVVYDVKGFQTAGFKLKAKIFNYLYPFLELELITKCPVKYQILHGDEWVDLKKLDLLRKKK